MVPLPYRGCRKRLAATAFNVNMFSRIGIQTRKIAGGKCVNVLANLSNIPSSSRPCQRHAKHTYSFYLGSSFLFKVHFVDESRDSGGGLDKFKVSNWP
jgi:hypothetical protein